MRRRNTIGIVGHIKTKPELIVDAADWERKVYETTLTRMRPSGTEDTFILQFDGRAAGSEEMMEKIKEGTEVLVGGEIRSKNIHNPKPEENRVKIYIYAEVIAVNDPPVKNQNEVTIRGRVCKPPKFRTTRRRTEKGKRVAATSIMIAANSASGANYIPCVCFGWQAFFANQLQTGDYVEVYGRFQSREYKTRIEGRELPYLKTVYEVCAIKLYVVEFGNKDEEDRKKEAEKKGGGMDEATDE